MKNTTQTQSSKNTWQGQAQLRLKEGSLIVLTILCIYLCMALLTFDVNDSSFTNSTGDIGAINNAGGYVGAWIADVLFSALGYCAWVFPLILMLKTFLAFKNRYTAPSWSAWLFILRTVSFALMLCSGAGLAYIHFSAPEVAPKNFNVLGEVLGDILISVLNIEGATLLLLAVFLFSVTVYANLSWFKIMEDIGGLTLRVLGLISGVFYSVFGRKSATPKLDNVDEYTNDSEWLNELHLDPVHADEHRSRTEPVLAHNQDNSAPQGRREPVIGEPFVPTEPAAPAPAYISGFEGLELSPVYAPALGIPAEPEVYVPAPRPVYTPAPAPAPEPTPAVQAVPVSTPAPEDVTAPPAYTAPDEVPVIPVYAPAPPPTPVAVPEAPAAPVVVPTPEVTAPAASTRQRQEPFVPTYAPTPEVPVEPIFTAAPTPAAQPISTAPVIIERRPSIFASSTTDITLPSLTLLDVAEKKKTSYSTDLLESMSRLLEVKLKEFGVDAHVESVHPGPVVTRFEIQLAPGIKVNRITNLAKDLARSMAMVSVRVAEVIPGKTTVGIEVPNEDRQMVLLSEVLDTFEFNDAKSPVTIALGHDIGGYPVVADLASMPHVLVAGTTGSGKSVGINAMILSVLFKSKPEDVRMIMIDPKMIELSVYDGIPHLLCPVVTDMKEAANALRWCVAEMERRYKLMSALGVRHLAGYNRKIKEAEEAGAPIEDPLFRSDGLHEQAPYLTKLPIIMVVVDEFADMVMVVGKTVEELVTRITQKARAAGVHLILATQRPSVDVITGLIKANIPTRIAFQVSSKIDSRTILDEGGAEQLLGNGDMLYLPTGSMPIRVHGAFVSDDEVDRVVAALKLLGAPNYINEILTGIEETYTHNSAAEGDEGVDSGEDDPLYDEAVRLVIETQVASISSVQRHLKVNYNRAASMVAAMETARVVSAPAYNGSRQVIVPSSLRD